MPGFGAKCGGRSGVVLRLGSVGSLGHWAGGIGGLVGGVSFPLLVWFLGLFSSCGWLLDLLVFAFGVCVLQCGVLVAWRVVVVVVCLLVGLWLWVFCYLLRVCDGSTPWFC